MKCCCRKRPDISSPRGGSGVDTGWVCGGFPTDTHPTPFPLYKGLSEDWGGCRPIQVYLELYMVTAFASQSLQASLFSQNSLAELLKTSIPNVCWGEKLAVLLIFH